MWNQYLYEYMYNNYALLMILFKYFYESGTGKGVVIIYMSYVKLDSELFSVMQAYRKSCGTLVYF